MSAFQTTVNSKCNRVLKIILLASIAEAIPLSSVELANARSLDMRGAVLLYSLYDRMHLRNRHGMAMSSTSWGPPNGSILH